MERIASAANAKVKLASSLHRRKNREALQQFVAEGVRLVEMAAFSDWPAVFGLCTPAAAAEARVQRILVQLAARHCPVYEVTEEIYRKAADTQEPQGLLLVMGQRRTGLSELLAVPQPLLVVLDGIQDPGNAGTILRTADAVGCTGLVCLENTVDIFADKTVRAAMGSLFHVPVAAGVSAPELLAAAKEKELRLYATALDSGAQPHFAADYRQPAMIVFGNEGNGVTAELLAAAEKLYIPMVGQAESLNVAAAAAVVLYEALRQRHYASSQQR